MSVESTQSSSASEGTARPRLLDQVCETIRRKYYSRRTEQVYVHWIKRFIYFTGKRHPTTLGELEVSAFLSDLTVNRRVAAATQNQALSALLFLYKEVCWDRNSAGSTACSVPRARRGCRRCSPATRSRACWRNCAARSG